MREYVSFLSFNTETKAELLSAIADAAKDLKPSVLVTPNLDGMRLAYKNAALRKAFRDAEFVTIDGKPVYWMAKIGRKKGIKEIIPGSDFSMELLQEANRRKLSICFFGGKPGVGEKAIERIGELYPDVICKGTICPDFGFEKDEGKCLQYINEINALDADIVFLCVGCPKADVFYRQYVDRFRRGVFLCVGATIDFIAGNVKRAPRWLSKIGMEWLYRLFHDFRRLFKRYWLDFWFLWKLLFVTVFRHKKILRLREE